jgi:hypothetical protein
MGKLSDYFTSLRRVTAIWDTSKSTKRFRPTFLAWLRGDIGDACSSILFAVYVYKSLSYNVRTARLEIAKITQAALYENACNGIHNEEATWWMTVQSFEAVVNSTL